MAAAASLQARAKTGDPRAMVAAGVSVHLSLVTIEEGEVTKRLAAWAGIFAIATAFAGVWGMNFEHMPELKWSYGYPLALGVRPRVSTGRQPAATATACPCRRSRRESSSASQGTTT